VNDPIYITIRTFQDDANLWRWELKLWRGDVDVRNEPAHYRNEAQRGYKSRRVAYNSGLAAAGNVRL
jgi:hypothetical protein